MKGLELTAHFCCVHLKVMGISHSLFEKKLEMLKIAKGKTLDTDLTASDLKELVEQYKDVYIEAKGEKFPSGALTILICEHKRLEAFANHPVVQ